MAKMKEVAAVKMQEQLPAVIGTTAADLQDMYGDMGKEHFNVPRLVILEQMSPEVAQNLGKIGEFFVKGPNEALGVKPLEIVVLMRSHSRMSWKPMAEGGGILCQAQDGKRGLGTPGGECAVCPQKDWIGSAKPKCDLYENFVVVRREDLTKPAGEAQLMAISGSRARLKDLKSFNNLLHPLMQRRLPLFAKSFIVTSSERNNPAVKNSVYRVFTFKPGNENALISDKEQAMAFQLFKQFSGNVTIDQEIPEHGPAAAPDNAPTY